MAGPVRLGRGPAPAGSRPPLSIDARARIWHCRAPVPIEICNAAQTLPHRPLDHRFRPVRHAADQEKNPHRRIQGSRARPGDGRTRRAARQSLFVRGLQAPHHRRHPAQQHRALRQPFLQPERRAGGLSRPRVHHVAARHQAGRGNRLRLRHRLPAARHRPLELPLLALPPAAGAPRARIAGAEKAPRFAARAGAADHAKGQAKGKPRAKQRATR